MNNKINSKIEKKYEFCVEFYDCDSMNIVWHGNYMKFLEAARCRFLSDVGYTYENMKQNCWVAPIVKMEQKFIRPLRFGEKFFVCVQLCDCLVFLRFCYLIFNSKGQIAHKAQSTQVALDLDGNTMYELPLDFRRSCASFAYNLCGDLGGVDFGNLGDGFKII